MKMIESVVYLYKKSERLVNGRFQRTAGPGEPPGSKEPLGRVNWSSFGSKEPLGRVNRSGLVPDAGRFFGIGGLGEPARGSLVRFKRFFPAVLNLSRTVPVPGWFQAVWDRFGSR